MTIDVFSIDVLALMLENSVTRDELGGKTGITPESMDERLYGFYDELPAERFLKVASVPFESDAKAARNACQRQVTAWLKGDAKEHEATESDAGLVFEIRKGDGNTYDVYMGRATVRRTKV